MIKKTVANKGRSYGSEDMYWDMLKVRRNAVGGAVFTAAPNYGIQTGLDASRI